MVTTTPHTAATSGSGRHHRLDATGGIAGLLVPTACAVAAWSTAVDGPNLRQGTFPWAASVGCALAGLTIAAVARRHHAVWRRGPRAAARTTAGALVAVAAFFVVLGGEDLVSRALGTPRVLSDSGLLTALGTLTASLLTLVVVPMGLLLTGFFTARAGVLTSTARMAVLAVGPVLVLGAMLTGVTGATWISASWPLLLGGCWAVIGAALLRDRSSR